MVTYADLLVSNVRRNKYSGYAMIPEKKENYIVCLSIVTRMEPALVH